MQGIQRSLYEFFSKPNLDRVICFNYKAERQETHIAWFEANMLQKITGNLIVNAIKYTPKAGTVIVNVSLESTSDPSNKSSEIIKTLTIEVEDSGIGITPESQEHIFEQYYRASSASSGFGIGLSLVKELIEILEGQVSVRSPLYRTDAIDYGSCFTVQLPIYGEMPQEEKPY